MFDPNNITEGQNIIKIFVALYANMRSWPNNNSQRNEINRIIQARRTSLIDDENEITKLLAARKYIVLQGAPGTGKTRMAKKIAEGQGQVFFTQFHAETSYSDFVYGIVPDVNATELNYSERKGVFVKAIEAALDCRKNNQNIF